jgi:pantoate--beta-alanine ligase
MKVARTRAGMRAARGGAGPTDADVALVPTMGAFHDGHLSLLRAARSGHDVVVVSIFVNPLQFGSPEDLSSYPRDEARDVELARSLGVDIAFVPSVEEMYPNGHDSVVSTGELGRVLEGASRPGHFDGVCTVVAKLLNLSTPRSAFFGQKDAQQVAVVRRMVTDLSFPVLIEVCETVRASDGLALSSRNALLDGVQRERATVLFRALEAGRDALDAGRGAQGAEGRMNEIVQAEDGVNLDYARAVDPDSFGAPVPGSSVLLVIAVGVGRVRLIDNLVWAVPSA